VFRQLPSDLDERPTGILAATGKENPDLICLRTWERLGGLLSFRHASTTVSNVCPRALVNPLPMHQALRNLQALRSLMMNRLTQRNKLLYLS